MGNHGEVTTKDHAQGCGGDSNVYVRAIASYQRGLHVHIDVFHREGS